MMHLRIVGVQIIYSQLLMLFMSVCYFYGQNNIYKIYSISESQIIGRISGHYLSPIQQMLRSYNYLRWGTEDSTSLG